MNKPARPIVDWVATTPSRPGRVWIDFESALVQVPIIARLLSARLRLEDYQRLLVNLRQQVIEGSRWISRAASNLTPAHEELRSMFLHHAIAEHRDFRLLEQNYVASRRRPRRRSSSAPKNIGSEALSAFMYQAASKPDPLGLLGAMFVIEGLGEPARRARGRRWIEDQLGLPEEAFSFFKYHGENDGDHIDMFDRALALAATDEATVADDIVRTPGSSRGSTACSSKSSTMSEARAWQRSDPDDPRRSPIPWLALWLDRSLPFTPEAKAALIRDQARRSRQFLLPLVRPFARLTIILAQLVHTLSPRWPHAPRLLHR